MLAAILRARRGYSPPKPWASAGMMSATALLNMRDFVRQAGLWYGIYHEAEIDSDFVDKVRENVEAACAGAAL